MELYEEQILAGASGSVEATLPASPTWQQAMKAAIRDGRELCRRLGIPAELASKEAQLDFPVFAPLEYVDRMEVGNRNDPLLLQVLGSSAETRADAGSALDPVGDLAARRQNGLLQKYAGRVLLITSGACAIHCRYCFRRHFPYGDVPKGMDGWKSALLEIEADDSLEEVILSGGDPLTASDAQLSVLLEQLDAIQHVQRIRFHTRFPVVIPQRVTSALIDVLRSVRTAVYFVLHFNHAAEINAAVAQAMRQLQHAGVTLLNQSVLLKGVNDSADDQWDLCRRLVNLQVMPYYLHQLDWVQGGTHFAVDDNKAQAIIEDLRGRLPGYAVPKLVREVPGGVSKTPL